MRSDVLASDRTNDRDLDINDGFEADNGGGDGSDDDGDDDGVRQSRGLILLIAHGLYIPMEDEDGQSKYQIYIYSSVQMRKDK